MDVKVWLSVDGSEDGYGCGWVGVMLGTVVGGRGSGRTEGGRMRGPMSRGLCNEILFAKSE